MEDDQNFKEEENSLPTKKGGTSKWTFEIVLIIVATAIIVGGVVLFSTKDIANQEGEISENTSTPDTTDLPVLSYLNHAENDDYDIQLKNNYISGDTISLRWIDDDSLDSWAVDEQGIVDICLNALDAEGISIYPKISKSGGCSYMYMEPIGVAMISSGEHEINIPNEASSLFESIPISYQIVFVVLDQLGPDGRSEWAGQVAQLESSQFTIVEEAINTSNWKTYRNEEYGFEFQYPKEWEFVQGENIKLNRIYGEGDYALRVTIEANVLDNPTQKSSREKSGIDSSKSTSVFGPDIEEGYVDGFEFFEGSIVNWGMLQYHEFIWKKDNNFVIFDIEYQNNEQLQDFKDILDTLKAI